MNVNIVHKFTKTLMFATTLGNPEGYMFIWWRFQEFISEMLHDTIDAQTYIGIV